MLDLDKYADYVIAHLGDCVNELVDYPAYNYVDSIEEHSFNSYDHDEHNYTCNRYMRELQSDLKKELNSNKRAINKTIKLFIKNKKKLQCQPVINYLQDLLFLLKEVIKEYNLNTSIMELSPSFMTKFKAYNDHLSDFENSVDKEWPKRLIRWEDYVLG